MALNKLEIEEDSTPILANIIRRHDAQSYAASIFVQGDDGGGTWTLQVSPDGGTTKYTVKDVSGNDITGTASAYHNYVIAGDSSKLSENLVLFFDLANSTNPDLAVYNYDNR